MNEFEILQLAIDLATKHGKHNQKTHGRRFGPDTGGGAGGAATGASGGVPNPGKAMRALQMLQKESEKSLNRAKTKDQMAQAEKRLSTALGAMKELEKNGNNANRDSVLRAMRVLQKESENDLNRAKTKDQMAQAEKRLSAALEVIKELE